MPSKLVFVIASEEQTKPKLLAERKEKLSLINKQLDARQSFDLSQLPEKVNKCSSAVHKLYGYDFLSPETFFSLFSLRSRRLFPLARSVGSWFPHLRSSTTHFNGLSSGFVCKLSWKLRNLLTRWRREENEQRRLLDSRNVVTEADTLLGKRKRAESPSQQQLFNYTIRVSSHTHAYNRMQRLRELQKLKMCLPSFSQSNFIELKRATESWQECTKWTFLRLQYFEYLWDRLQLVWECESLYVALENPFQLRAFFCFRLRSFSVSNRDEHLKSSAIFLDAFPSSI